MHGESETAPILVECPSCHGEGIKPVQASPAGPSPYDTEVKCWFCCGLKQVTPQQAEIYVNGFRR